MKPRLGQMDDATAWTDGDGQVGRIHPTNCNKDWKTPVPCCL
jgi:hypothetical protein